MPNPVAGLLEVYKDMVEVLLVLEIFVTEDSKVEDLLRGAPSCPEACLFFSDDLLRLWLQSGSDHDLLMMTFHLRLKKISKPKHTRLKFDLEKS